MLPTSLREMSPCDVAESVFGRPQNTSWLRKPCGFRVARLWAQSANASDIIFRCLFVIVLRLECAFHISGSRVNAVSQCAHREHAPNDVGPCDVAESVIGRPQNTSSWTGSEAMRYALEFFASAQSYVCTHLRASPERGSLFPRVARGTSCDCFSCASCGLCSAGSCGRMHCSSARRSCKLSSGLASVREV